MQNQLQIFDLRVEVCMHTWLEQRVVSFCLVFSSAVCPALNLYVEVCIPVCLVYWVVFLKSLLLIERGSFSSLSFFGLWRIQFILKFSCI